MHMTQIHHASDNGRCFVNAHVYYLQELMQMTVYENIIQTESYQFCNVFQ